MTGTALELLKVGTVIVAIIVWGLFLGQARREHCCPLVRPAAGIDVAPERCQ